MPASFEAHLKQDIAQEVYLATLDGRISQDEIEQFAWSIAVGELRKFEGVRGGRSLEDEIGEDGTATLGDMISIDDTSSLLMYGLEIGGF